MNRNLVYILVAVLAATSIGLGWRLYRDRQATDRVEIRLDDHGLSIERR
jgi:hypothetical protein